MTRSKLRFGKQILHLILNVHTTYQHECLASNFLHLIIVSHLYTWLHFGQHFKSVNLFRKSWEELPVHEKNVYSQHKKKLIEELSCAESDDGGNRYKKIHNIVFKTCKIFLQHICRIESLLTYLVKSLFVIKEKPGFKTPTRSSTTEGRKGEKVRYFCFLIFILLYFLLSL